MEWWASKPERTGQVYSKISPSCGEPFPSIHAIARVVSLKVFCTFSWLVSIHTIPHSDPFQKRQATSPPWSRCPATEELPWRPSIPMSTPLSTHVGNGLTPLRPPLHHVGRYMYVHDVTVDKVTIKLARAAAQTSIAIPLRNLFFPFLVSAFVDFWSPNKNLASPTRFSILRLSFKYTPIIAYIRESSSLETHQPTPFLNKNMQAL